MASFIAQFRQAAPYLNLYHQQVFVISFDGHVVDAPHFPRLMADIALLSSLGIRLVLVAGMRLQINRCLQIQNLTSHYAQQWRITDKNALNCAKAACGQINSDIQALLMREQNNIRVCTGNFITAKPVGVRQGVDFLSTGEVRRVAVTAIENLLQHNIVLVPPLGYSPTGEIFNLSYGEVAASVAQALKAEKWLCLPENHQWFANTTELSLSEAQQWQVTDAENDKLRHLAIKSCQNGVKRVHLLNAHCDGVLLQELFRRDGAGQGNSLMLSQASYEDMRTATIDDVGGILNLIRPLEQAGVLVRRSRRHVEMEIQHFVVQHRDNQVIACAALYPYPDNKMGELACLVVHNDYQNQGRGDVLLRFMQRHAQDRGLEQLFVLTTQTAHWFLERGFKPMDLHQLPLVRQSLYNYQRSSQIFIKTLRT
jgi:amino-acid N-acetyltransferase